MSGTGGGDHGSQGRAAHGGADRHSDGAGVRSRLSGLSCADTISTRLGRTPRTVTDTYVPAWGDAADYARQVLVAA